MLQVDVIENVITEFFFPSWSALATCQPSFMDDKTRGGSPDMFEEPIPTNSCNLSLPYFMSPHDNTVGGSQEVFKEQISQVPNPSQVQVDSY